MRMNETGSGEVLFSARAMAVLAQELDKRLKHVAGRAKQDTNCS